MNFDWKQITHFRKVQVVSIEFTEQGVYYHWILLKRLKGDISIVESDEKLNSESIQGQLVSNIPIIVHVYGKGVLNKVTDQNEDYLENVLMNADPDEFFINYLDLEDKRYVSFSRKKPINEALSFLSSVNDNILDIVIGPYHVLVDGIHQNTRSTPIGEIVFNNGTYSFEKTDSINRPKFNGEILMNSFWAVTLGTAFLNNELTTSVFNSKERKQKQSNFRDKQHFKFIGVGAIVIFLVALIGNYFYQGHINEKNADLEAKIMVYSDNLKKIDQIDQEMLRKKQLIANSGIIRSNYFSTTLDQIGSSVPSTIQLEEVQVYPLERKLKKNEKPEFKRKTIKIAGSTKSSEYIDAWIDKLNELGWVDNVAILSFTTNEDKNTAFFELKIVER